jgi:UDP-3-O-[3-hydroxymyristoyl] N-acetylglucosamine deacetylase
MHSRLQRTIRRVVGIGGIGFFGGRDVTIRFQPAEPDHGIAFRRLDQPGAPVIPARIEYAVDRERRTAIERDGTAVEMIEHVMAALAGLQIDNCLIELDGPEPPGFDGSAMPIAELLQSAQIVEQAAQRNVLVVGGTVFAGDPQDDSEMTYRPIVKSGLAITYHLDYGARCPIVPQELSVDVTPETFLRELAFARTFLLASEAEALRRAGYGSRITARDLLIFGPEGPIETELRAPDECARHKILDCLGDFALLGCDVHGHFNAYRSGHHLNRQMVRKLVARAAAASTAARAA